MKESYTHISVILDRTGSMESIRNDTIGGFNTFLGEQKSQPSLATLTLVQFDTQDPYEVVHKFKPIQEVSPLTRETYVPRASTPLLDAMGRGINDLDACLAALPDGEKPARVVIVVVTDGQENSSHEFRKEQIVKMIKEKQEKQNWQFVFLSADLKSIGDAREYGIAMDSSMAYLKNPDGTSSAWKSLSGRTSDYRSARRKNVSFTEEDRKKQEEGQQ